MRLIIVARCLLGEPVQVEMPRPNMVIDLIPNFECFYHENGMTLTLTRTDDKESYHGPFEFRAYDPATESIPDFKSLTYNYLGVDGERAPPKTTILIIDPSVTIIKAKAFSLCNRIKKCLMHDRVSVIEKKAFSRCSAMKMIRLSRSLRQIGKMAFHACTSLDAIFLPSSLEIIEHEAFHWCTNIRILPLPINIDILQLGEIILQDCHTFFRITTSPETSPIKRYVLNQEEEIFDNDNEVHQSVIDFYRGLQTLHKACLDTNVTAQTFNESIRGHDVDSITARDHDGMTPLHILSLNPHADSGAILACFHASINNVFVGDNRGMTPLEYLREHHDIEVHTLLVTALCMHREMGSR